MNQETPPPLSLLRRLSRWVVSLSKKLALALFAALFACLLLEAVARIAAPAPPPYLLRDGIYLNDLPLVNGRPSCRDQRAEGAAREEPPEKGDDEIRVAVFGESSVVGSPWGQPLSPPAMLYDQLVRAFPHRRFSVLNMGRATSYTMDSYYYLLAAAAYEPDIVVFYQGLNDRVDADAEACWPVVYPGWDSLWRSLVERSHVLWSVRVRLPELYLRANEGPQSHEVPAMQADRCDRRAAFAAWTELLVSRASEIADHVVVTSPVKNALCPVDMALHRRLRSLAPEVLLPPDIPGLRAAMGCLLTPGCDFGESLADLLRVRTFAPAAFADRDEVLGHAAAWQQAAARHGATYIDFQAYLSGLSAQGLTTTPLVVDEVHLSPEGYWLLAAHWTHTIAELLGGSAEGTLPSLAEARPDLARYEEDLGRQGWSLVEALRITGMQFLRKKMPFMGAGFLLEAATRFDDEPSALAVGWLRRSVGLAPGLTPARDALLETLDIGRHIEAHRFP